MSGWETIDFFNDGSLVEDPYPYFEELRAQCPVLPLPHLGVVAVTGYDEAHDVYRDPDTFSSCNSVIGPFVSFPVPLEGDDVSATVARYRDQLPMHEHMVTMDPPQHTQERALLMRLITPKRLRDNEAFMWRLADQQLDELVPDGRCEFIRAYTQPFAMLVVVRGGPSSGWPPDRPIEWITIGLVCGLALSLFLACVTIGWWYPGIRNYKKPTTHDPDSSSQSPLL